MADRGVDDENPFSFKAFVKEKKTVVAGNSLFYDTDDIFEENPESLNNISSKKDKLNELSATKANGIGKKEQKENPFSFKKFLSASSSQAPSGKEPPTNKNIPKDDIFNLDENSEFNKDTYTKPKILLPVDFDNNYAKETKLLSCDLLLESKIDIPSNETLGVIQDLPIPIIDNSEENISATLPLDNKKQKLPLALPDFLSDGAAMKLKDADHTYDDLLEKLKNLEEENIMLKKELSREKQLGNEKNLRIKQLTIDLEQQKKKEVEETAVLEKAVQQVEENLVTTTKRAVQAEANVASLKKENKMLQGQVNSLLLTNETLKNGDRGMSEIKERTKYTSEQLASASVLAEKNIKELMTGVEKLKLLSQVLASIDKVSDVWGESSTEQNTKSS